MLYIILLPLIVVGLLLLPIIVAVKKRKSGKSVRNAFIGNICSFFGVMIICAALPIGLSAYADEAAEPATAVVAENTEAAAEATTSDGGNGMLYLAAALAVGLGSIGGGIAVAAAAPAAIGAVSEEPKSFSKALIFVALGEGCALYGFVVALLMLFI